MNELPLTPPAALSPSSIETWRQCPLKFKYTRIDGLQDPSGPEAVLGSFVHEILEHLYLLPAPDRTMAAARELARVLWTEKWQTEAHGVVPSAGHRQFRWQAWWCVENLFALENPQEVHLEGVEHKFESNISGVAVRGIIDRWSLDDGVVVIGDYKTGKTPALKYRDNKFFQLLIYALALSEDMNLPVGKMELLYLKNGDKLQRSPTAADYELVSERVVGVRTEIESACNTGEFAAIPSRLCDWCSFKTSICPYWNGEN